MSRIRCARCAIVLGFLFCFAFSFSSLAQVTVTDTLTDGTGTTYKTAYLHFQLNNCGNNVPVVPSSLDTLVQDSFDLRPNGSGVVTGSIVGNDQITCGNVKSTYYTVTPMKDSSHPLRQGFPYVICSASSTLGTCGNQASLGTFTLVTAIPMTQNPPSPGFTETYGNPSNSQTITQPGGTEMDFFGTFNLNGSQICTFAQCNGGGGGGGISGTGNTGFLTKFSGNGSNPPVANSDVFTGATVPSVSTANNVSIPRTDVTNHTSSFNWQQSPSSPSSLSSGANTVTLAPCPYGLSSTYLVDTGLEGSPNYYVYIAGTGTAEAAAVTATTCTPGAASGTITFTAANTHSAGYTVGSATSGMQEAINDCDLSAAQGATAVNCDIELPATPGTPFSAGTVINTYAPVVTHTNNLVINGHGTRISCNHNQQCIVLGNRDPASMLYHHNKLRDVRVMPNYNGTAPQVNLIQSITQSASASLCTYTVTFTGNHDLVAGEWVYVGGSLNQNYVSGVRKITAVPAANEVQWATAGTSSGGVGGAAGCIAWSTMSVYGGGYVVAEYVGIEDNLGQHGSLDNVTIDGWASPFTANKFHFGLVITTDEPMTMNAFDSFTSSCCRSSDAHATFAVIMSPGNSGFGNTNGSAIAQISNFDIEGSCAGLGYDPIIWLGGNDLNLTNGFLQNWSREAVVAIRRRGGFGGFTSKGVHWENGCNSNPYGWPGLGGLNTSMFQATTNDSNTIPGYPTTFASLGNTATRSIYYVMPNSFSADTMCSTQPNDPRCVSWNSSVVNAGNGPLLPIGQALIDSGTGGTVQVYWPTVRDATSYNLYKVNIAASQTSPFTMPLGTGNFGVATSINPLTACTDTFCTISDTTGLSPSSVTVPQYGATNGFAPFVDWWPVGIFIGVPSTIHTNNMAGGTPYFGMAPLYGFATTNLPGTNDIFFNTNSTSAGPGSFQFQTSDFQEVGYYGPANTAYLKNWFFPMEATSGSGSDSGLITNRKGVINTGTSATPGYPFDVWTIWDSNIAKTRFTSGGRPTNDANDSAIGLDQAGGVSVRGQNSISEYIGTLNNNSNFLERLTSSLKTFNVPIQSTCVALSTLGSASGKAGQFSCISDSTTVSAEGQTCTGSSTNTALAFSNGTVWKCF